jgi:hypothetical protein
VRLLAGFGVPVERICKVITNKATRRPVSVAVLERHFEAELSEGACEMDAAACLALAQKIKRGSLTAIIWYQKNQMGWSDFRRTTTTSTNLDLTLKIDPQQLAKELEERGLPPAVFGIDAPKLERPASDNCPKDAGSASEGHANGAGVTADALDDPLIDEAAEAANAQEAARREEERAYLNARMLQHVNRYG